MDDLEKSLLSDTKPVCPETHPMGIGKLADPSVVFVRKFRWTLSGIWLLEQFVKKVDFDFKNQKIVFQAMEVVVLGEDINIQEWLERDLTHEGLVFTTYDGCGAPLYSYSFGDLEIESDTASFDYASSEESYRTISVKYNTVERICHTKKDHVKKKGFIWRLSVEGGVNGPKKVTINHRPTIDIEETEINFLNAKMWIPGKSKWQNITLVLDEQSQCLLEDILKPDLVTARLSMFDRDDNMCETWTLKNTRLVGMSENAEKTTITLSYNEVLYKHHEGESCHTK